MTRPPALGDYACCVGTTGADWAAGMTPPNGAFQLGVAGIGIRLLQITDGTSTTLLIGDKQVAPTQVGLANNDCCIYNGQNINCSARSAGVNFPLATSVNDPSWKYGSCHTNVVQFVFADGHVEALSTGIAPQTLGYLANISDGNPIPPY